MPAPDEKWSKSSVLSMTKTDAILRESMQYPSFMTSVLDRTVVAKDGITTPDGLYLKRGNVISVPALPVHRDPIIYHGPNSFVFFRFLRPTGEDIQQQ